jgi:hypothetical protein
MPRGKKTKYNDILFRSSPEAELAQDLDSWKNLEWEYEDDVFTLNVVLTKKYTPDFRITTLDTNQIFYVEYKGEFTKDDRKKALLMKKQYPDVDLRFVFQRNNRLSKKSRTTYEEWCIRHGFPCAIGRIPKEWIYGG